MQRLKLLASLLAALVLLTASPAEATGAHLGTLATAHVGASALVLSSWPTILAGMCGFGSSQITAFLTHRRAPQWIKSGVNLALSTLAGVLINLTVVAGSNWKDYVATIAVAWLVALGTHFSGMTALIGNSSANVGIGENAKPLTTPPPDDASDSGAF